MIQSVADYLEVSEDAFAQTGAFNAFLGRDTRLFISPVLLRGYRGTHFADAFSRLSEHLDEVMSLLARSNGADDYWVSALRILRFEEVPEIGLGYSVRGTQGARITRGQKETLLRGLHRLVRLGVTGAENLAFAMPLESRLGPDAISDFLASVLKKNLLRFTQSVCEKLAVPGDRLRSFRLNEHEEESFLLPVHPSLRQRRKRSGAAETSAPRPIILIPRALLSRRPTVTSAQKMASLFPAKSSERGFLDELFERIAKRVRARELTRRTAGDGFEEFLRENPALLGRALDSFAKTLGEYAWEGDPDFQWKFYPIALAMMAGLGQVQPGPVKTRSELHDFVVHLCERLKDQFERREKTESLFHGTGDERTTDEMRIQSVLDAVLEMKVEDVRLNCERASHGSAKPDFEISRGPDLKACIEIKLLKADSPPIESGQLEAYQKRGAYSTFALMVFCLDAAPEHVASARKLQCSFRLEKYFVDITPLPPPSRR
jgi:hypothetical protein